MDNPHILILGASLVVIISFLFNFLAKKTNIPSVLMLMVLGYVLSLFVPIESIDLMGPLEILGTVGVILIVLEAALDLDLERKKMPILWRSLVLSILLLGLTSALVAFVIHYVLDLEYYRALLYGVPLSVMSSAIIIPSVQRLTGHKKEFLIFESAFSDIFGIILFYALLDIPEAGGVSLDFTGGLVGGLILTLLIAFVATYGLIFAFQNVTGHIKLFVVIAVLLALYSLGKLFHLSSLILILVFGLIINNKDVLIPKKLRAKVKDDQFDVIEKDFKTLTLETAFVVRTFFFVVFGMTITLGGLLHGTVWLISGLTLVIIYAWRYTGLKVFIGSDIDPEIYVAPRGLITILLYYAIPEEYIAEEFQPGILLLVILVSSLIMTYGLIRRANGQKKASSQESGAESQEAPVEATSYSSEESSAP